MVSKYNRPFLVITHIQTPEKGQRTNLHGWTKDAEWATHESMKIVDRLNTKTLTTASIILDILDEKVVKNRYDSISNTEIFDEYIKKYLEDVQEGMIAWVRGNPENFNVLLEWSKKYAPEETQEVIDSSVETVNGIIEESITELSTEPKEAIDATFEELPNIETNER
jgi:uncharacterized protein with ATP-grasp and redox domains